jgi:hypothetical protein
VIHDALLRGLLVHTQERQQLQEDHMTAENTYKVTAPDMIVLIHGLWVTENELPGYACLGLFTNVLEGAFSEVRP